MCAQVCVELPSNPPGGSTWLEEVVDEGEARRSKSRRRAACAGLRMNSREICRAVSGSKGVHLGNRVIKKICGGIHHWRERQRRIEILQIYVVADVCCFA